MSLSRLLASDTPFRRLINRALRSPGPQYNAAKDRHPATKLPLAVATPADDPSLLGATFDLALRALLENYARAHHLPVYRSSWAAWRLRGLATDLLTRVQLDHDQWLRTTNPQQALRELQELLPWLTLIGQLENAVHSARLPGKLYDHPQTTELCAELLAQVPAVLKPAHELVLAPHFGLASQRVGGAEADLIIDTCLLDIKTGMRQHLTLADRRQLAAYLLLASAGGVWTDERRHHVSLSHAGIYFARSSSVQLLSLDELLDEKKWSAVQDEFQALLETDVFIPN